MVNGCHAPQVLTCSAVKHNHVLYLTITTVWLISGVTEEIVNAITKKVIIDTASTLIEFLTNPVNKPSHVQIFLTPNLCA